MFRANYFSLCLEPAADIEIGPRVLPINATVTVYLHPTRIETVADRNNPNCGLWELWSAPDDDPVYLVVWADLSHEVGCADMERVLRETLDVLSNHPTNIHEALRVCEEQDPHRWRRPGAGDTFATEMTYTIHLSSDTLLRAKDVGAESLVHVAQIAQDVLKWLTHRFCLLYEARYQGKAIIIPHPSEPRSSEIVLETSSEPGVVIHAHPRRTPDVEMM